MNTNIKRWIKEKKIIGLGSSRVVFDLGNGRVLKVAKTKRGIKGNMKEVNIYKSAPSKARKYLGTIKNYASRYRWLIMTRYKQKFLKSKKYKKRIYTLRMKLIRYGIIPRDITYNKGGRYQNLRLKHGRIVIIDYGNFNKRHKLQH
jgi:hypothetical protein